MQITAFKAILARIIYIQGCEDYENTFARMEPKKPNLNVQSDSNFATVKFLKSVSNFMMKFNRKSFQKIRKNPEKSGKIRKNPKIQKIGKFKKSKKILQKILPKNS